MDNNTTKTTMTREEKIKFWESLQYYQIESQIKYMIAAGNTEDIDAALEIRKRKLTTLVTFLILFPIICLYVGSFFIPPHP